MLKNLILVIVCIFIAGCATIYNPATGIEEVVLIDTVTEVSIGQKMAWQVARHFPISQDIELNHRVKKIGRHIARVSDRQDLAYRFYVIQSQKINAFTIPGGYIYVYSGLMKNTDDDELAIVLAHEVGHIAARHPAKKMEINMGYDLLNSLIFGPSTETEMREVMNIFFNIIASGYERGDELLADRVSVRYAKLAGHDPLAAIRFMRKLQEYERARGAPAYSILSSHPPIEDRIRNVEIELARFKEEGYEKKKPASLPRSLEPKPSPTPLEKRPSLKPIEKKSTYRGTKICPTCHREYPLNFNYCTKCGSKLE